MSVVDRANSAHATLYFWGVSLVLPVAYWIVQTIYEVGAGGGQLSGEAAVLRMILLGGLALGYSVLASLGYFLGGWLAPLIDGDHAGRLCMASIALGVLCFAVWRVSDPNHWVAVSSPWPAMFVLVPMGTALLWPLIFSPLVFWGLTCLGMLREVR